MNKEYRITKLNDKEFAYLITLYDFETPISYTLKRVEINDENGFALVDTALRSGMNKFRFISVPLIYGKIDIENYDYVDPSENIVKIANSILAEDDKELNFSVLTEKEKEIIKIKKM